MVNAKLHVICGNCGCNNMWEYEHKNDELYLICNNCGTIHTLDEIKTTKIDKKRTQDISINLNETVKVILSKKGLDIYRKEMEDFNSCCEKHQVPIYPKRDDKGFVKDQLWSIISMYGKSIGVGLEPPFADNCIHFELKE